MADKNTLTQMLENLVNGDQAKAEELFHEYVVAKSREIYEDLIESEMKDDDKDDKDDDVEEDIEESSDNDNEDDSNVEEDFEEVAIEADDDAMMGGDPTDDLEADIDAGPEGHEGDEEEKSEEELFQDLDAIVDELQAKFDQLKSHEAGEKEMGGEEGEEDHEMSMKDDFDLETVREYVEKVPAGHGVEKKGAAEGSLVGTGAHGDKPSVNAKSTVAGKNDMGGTAENILGSKEEPDNNRVGAGRKVQGSALSDQNAKEENFGNVNVPGGNAGHTAFKHKEAGHGAEKKGEAEGKYAGTGSHSDSVSVNKQSLFRGRR